MTLSSHKEAITISINVRGASLAGLRDRRCEEDPLRVGRGARRSEGHVALPHEDDGSLHRARVGDGTLGQEGAE
jgi:hypothetical protein